MREGGKKTFKKENIEPIFGKVNEGDQIKNIFDIFQKKLIRATKKQAKQKIAAKIFFNSRNELYFRNIFFMFWNWQFIFGNWHNLMRALGRKNTWHSRFQ